jgi:hypothetical protein
MLYQDFKAESDKPNPVPVMVISSPRVEPESGVIDVISGLGKETNTPSIDSDPSALTVRLAVPVHGGGTNVIISVSPDQVISPRHVVT